MTVLVMFFTVSCFKPGSDSQQKERPLDSLFFQPSQKHKDLWRKMVADAREFWVSPNDGSGARVFGITLDPKPTDLNPEAELNGRIVFFHGNAGNISGHVSFVAPLAERGFQVTLFDYRGYGDSTLGNDRGVTRRGAISDGVAVLKNAFESDSAAAPAIVMGHSLGGALSPASIVEWGGKVDFLMLASTFPSYRREALSVLRFWLFKVLLWPLSFFGVSEEYSGEQFYPEISKSISNILVAHAADDDLVPFEFGQEIHQALPHSEFLEFRKGSGHVNYPAHSENWDGILGFLCDEKRRIEHAPCRGKFLESFK